MMKNSNKRQNWFVLVGSVIIGCTATACIIGFNQEALQGKHAEGLMTSIEGKLYKLSALEWEAIAEEKFGKETEEEVKEIREEISDLFLELNAFHQNKAQLTKLINDYREYNQLLDREFKFLEAGQIKQAIAIDREKVDPKFAQISKQLDVLSSLYKAQFEVSYQNANIGIAISLILAGITIGLLFWYYNFRLWQSNYDLHRTLKELQTSQAHLVQSEKMSSLGRMVTGVAHEINGPVGFIHGNLTYIQEYIQGLLCLVQLYQQHYPNPVSEIQTKAEEIDLEFIRDDLPKILSSMQMGSIRICEIILSLRNFYRLDKAEIKPVDIHKGLDNTLIILNNRLKVQPKRPEIRVIKDYGTIPPVECYAGLINQVFMNILANAIDALEEKIEKQTSQERKDNPSQITLHTSLIDELWVQIAIADNGFGIPQEIQKYIFDPFFTTKPVGKGTGMGMSISYQIVTEKHGGKLECFSSFGKGTEFVIKIPLQQILSGTK